MNIIEKHQLIHIGKDRSKRIALSIILISLHTIYFYHSTKGFLDMEKLIQQGVRLLLTIGLLYALYLGKSWARLISLILFTIAIIMAVYGIITIQAPFVNKIPLLVITIIYSAAIYHFGFSREYKAFSEYQNRK